MKIRDRVLESVDCRPWWGQSVSGMFEALEGKSRTTGGSSWAWPLRGKKCQPWSGCNYVLSTSSASAVRSQDVEFCLVCITDCLCGTHKDDLCITSSLWERTASLRSPTYRTLPVAEHLREGLLALSTSSLWCKNTELRPQKQAGVFNHDQSLEAWSLGIPLSFLYLLLTKTKQNEASVWAAKEWN